MAPRIWTVQISQAVDKKRTPLDRETLPEEPEGQFYSTWIAESEGEFHSEWIIWDIDNEDVTVSLNKCREFVQKLLSIVPRDFIRVVFSTNKGFHVYLASRIVGMQPSRTLHGALRRFCLRLFPDADGSLYSPNHILGLPNSIHRTTGLYYVSIPIEKLFEWNIEQMKHYAESPQNIEPATGSCPSVKQLCDVWNECEVQWKGMPSLADLVEIRVPEDWSGWQRGSQKSNERIFKLCKEYRKKMISSCEALVLIKDINFRIYPPFKLHELITIVNSAYKN